MLKAPFEPQQILESIKACAGDKAPGPDGYLMELFKQCWDVINSDLVGAVQNFHEKYFFEKSLNATFVTMIPKKVDAEEQKNFMPISLIGGLYKIIANFLAERVKRVIHSLVDRHQMAFIKSRQIIEAILIANECIETVQKSNKPCIVCKLDIQKAYDFLNWDFLIQMLERMGFGARWIRWIKHYIGTVRFSIIVNRVPTSFFFS